MSKQHRDLGLLFGLALLVRLLAALPQQQPNYMDAAYSYVNALNLAAGRGFVEDFVWNYLNNLETLPQPSHLYWMPLTSILAWLGMVVGGATYRAAQIPFVVVSALLAPISYWATYTLSGQRWPGWLAGLFVIFSGFYFPFWTAIDNFTPFAVAGSLALLMAWEGMAREDERRTTNDERRTTDKVQSHIPYYLLAAGAFAGLAHLARADGPLLLIAIILIYLLRVISPSTHNTQPCPERSRRDATHNPVLSEAEGTQHAIRNTFHVSRFTFYLILGYALVITPWFIRNWLVVGTPLPTAGSQTIWLATANNLFSSYNGLYSFGRELSARTFFAQGPGPILQGRWWVLTANLQTVLAVWSMIFLAPLTLVGVWHLRRHLLSQLVGLYALLLFMAMTLVFAFPGALGGLFHSGGALLPFIYAAAVIGLDGTVDWVASRRRQWDAKLAKRFFGLGLVLMAVALSSFIYYRRVVQNNAWNNADSLYPTVAAWVAEQDPAAIVMINNPPAYRYHGGGLSVVVPNENLETTLQVARKYRVDYLILEPNHPAPLTDLYYQTVTYPRLSLVKTFGDIYVFEIVEP